MLWLLLNYSDIQKGRVKEETEMMLDNAVPYFQILYHFLEIVGMMISDRFGPSDIMQTPVQHEAGMLAKSCGLMFRHKQQPKTGVSNTAL